MPHKTSYSVGWGYSLHRGVGGCETRIAFSKHTQNPRTNPMNKTQARGEAEGEFTRIRG